MTEFELKQGLSQEVEVPAIVEERLAQVCAQAVEGARPARHRRPLRAMRIGVAAAALGAVLCISAAAVSFASRGTVYQAFFGNESYPSVEARQEYDEFGRLILDLPNSERVPVNEDQAEALVGAYLSEEGYVWQVEDYTMTIESYLVDENTGTAKVCYILHHPGGIQGLNVFPVDGELAGDGTGIGNPRFCVLENDPESCFYGEYLSMGGRDRVDLTRSTEDTLYITSSLAESGCWKAADGFRVRFIDLSRNKGSILDQSLVDTLDLPALESLPALTITNPETGEPVAVISSIGMLLNCGYLELGDRVRDISITYTDGSTYLVRDDANNIQNYDYALGSGDGPDEELRLVFNRLIDPEQVASVTIDGRTYAVK